MGAHRFLLSRVTQFCLICTDSFKKSTQEGTLCSQHFTRVMFYFSSKSVCCYNAFSDTLLVFSFVAFVQSFLSMFMC